MSLRAMGEESASEIRLPADVDWEMLDKSRFFFLGAALFSGVSATLYPIVVLKTRQQVLTARIPCLKMSASMLRTEGLRGFYRGFGTSLVGTIPARALYMGALEMTKSSVGTAAVRLGFSEASAAAIANAAAGLNASMAAQVVWTPIDVVSQRLMVQGAENGGFKSYSGGLDAFRKIIYSHGVKGLYRGFGLSILTYAPSSAVWWASYSISHRAIWARTRRHFRRKDDLRAEGKAGLVAVQGISAAVASGVSALVTMPMDTIKTRMQVLDGGGEGNMRRPATVVQTVRNLVKESGISGCYRGLGPRWASMSMSATTMITTYEFLKRLSSINQETRKICLINLRVAEDELLREAFVTLTRIVDLILLL